MALDQSSKDRVLIGVPVTMLLAAVGLFIKISITVGGVQAEQLHLINTVDEIKVDLKYLGKEVRGGLAEQVTRADWKERTGKMDIQLWDLEKRLDRIEIRQAERGK